MKKVNKQEQAGRHGKFGLFIGLALFAGLIIISGCSKTTASGNTAVANSNTADKANTTVTKADEPVKSLKPADVSPDKAVKVIDLIDSITADKDGWKGKEVAVTAYVSATASSGKIQTLTLLNDQTATNKKNVSCTFQGEKDDTLFTKTIEVKGKIDYISTDGENKTINLNPCQVKK